jgi:hypothetical protein
MIKVAAKPPPERANMSERTCYAQTLPDLTLTPAVRQWRDKLDYGNLPKVKAWNVEVNKEMMKVEARVLPPPTIQYTGQTQRPNFG